MEKGFDGGHGVMLVDSSFQHKIITFLIIIPNSRNAQLRKFLILQHVKHFLDLYI